MIEHRAPQMYLNACFRSLFQPGPYPCLDGVRAVSILLVLAHHNGELWDSIRHHRMCGYRKPCIDDNETELYEYRVINFSGFTRWFCANGGMGVDLFFVLSGFLIGHMLFKERSLNQGVACACTFLARRWFRIVPILLIKFVYDCHIKMLSRERGWVAFLFTGYGMFGYHLNWSRYSIIWSVNLEMQMYVISLPLTFLLYAQPNLLKKLRLHDQRLLWAGILSSFLIRAAFIYSRMTCDDKSNNDAYPEG
jgi:peptidoglycan/LPS O-acetylase OafA/YrhL